MARFASRPRAAVLLEYGFAVAVLALIARALWWVYEFGQFPQPFFYEPRDTFMDWFAVAYWAHTSAAYDSWMSIYPPISFVFTGIVGIPSCWRGTEALTARYCDWVGLAAIHGIFVLNVVLVSRLYMRIDRRTALPRAVALSTGMPMLYALERGNLLILAFTLGLLGFAPLLRSARIKWLCVAAAINFKVYLVTALLAQLLQRRWLAVECTVIMIVIIYFVTYGIYGHGTPMEVYRDIGDFANTIKPSQFLDLWYANTYQPLTFLLHGETFATSAIVGSHVADTALLAIAVVTRLAQAMVMAAAAATWLRPEAVPPHRVVFLGLIIALISSEVTGYTNIWPALFVFMERWKGIGRPIAIVCCYLLALPADWAFYPVPVFSQFSFWANREIGVQYAVALGMFTRPGLLLLVAGSLSAVTIRDVWIDIRRQGWAGRWRFRRDWAVLPGVLHPRRPPAR